MSHGTGMFAVSLDFELHWGVQDQYSIAAYRDNLEGARLAIPRMLDMFVSHGIHATWAIVGCLFSSTKEDLLKTAPTHRPRYSQESLNAYRVFDSLGRNEEEDPYHYAASLIRQIGARPGQEIASHTFSHYYCLESGQDQETFRQDLKAAMDTASRKGYRIRSIVLPGNQWNPAYEEILCDQGFVAYRGNQPGWMYAAVTMRRQTLLRRAARLLDSYVNITGHGNHTISPVENRAIVNLPASRFLRPVSKTLRLLEPLRRRRITTGMRLAAETGGLYHLWWHPHNFGVGIEANLAFLEEILFYFAELSTEYGMRSHTMGEIADILLCELDERPCTHNEEVSQRQQLRHRHA